MKSDSELVGAERDGASEGPVEDRLEAMRDATNLAVHELRAPLVVAGGYTSMLADGSLGPVPERWAQPLQLISDNLRAAGKMVDDLLLMARLEGETDRPSEDDLDLVAVAKAAASRAQSRADLVGGTLVVEADEPEVHALGDGTMAATVVDNLLSNAFLYGGKSPAVTVRVSRASGPLISVTDNGSGIPPDLTERIFERFYRAGENAGVRGSGLGLYLSSKLASRQGGRVSLDWSKPGEGSTFSLRLPSA